MDDHRVFRTKLENRGAHPVVVAVALVIVAFVGINLLFAGGDEKRPAAVSVSPSPAPSSSATSRPSASPAPAVVSIDSGDLRWGRNSVRVGAIEFSLDLPSGWEGFGPGYGNYVTKSARGPQGAEAKLFWAIDSDTAAAWTCAYLRSRAIGPSAADLAAAVAAVPGTDVVASPSDIVVGGLPAKHVVLSVRDDVGCDPGFFFAYPIVWGGALWPETVPGDTIRVWIVDVDGTRLFIEGATHEDAGPALDEDIQRMVDSIQFE